jgi:hypothetical protein
MFTKNKIIEEFKNRNIDAILCIDDTLYRLIFYVKDEATKKSINDLMPQIKPMGIYHNVNIADIVSTGLAILPACKQIEKPKSFWERIKIKFGIFKKKNSKHRKVIRHGWKNGLPPAPPPPPRKPNYTKSKGAKLPPIILFPPIPTDTRSL